MTPTKKWGDGDGSDGLLGCSIRFCLFDIINDVVWHVLVGCNRFVLPSPT